MIFVDSHAHIDGSEYDADRDEVIQRARDAGVTTILTVGTGDPHSGGLERAVQLAETHRDIYAAIGTHPHDARLFDIQAEERISRLIEDSSRVIAWGEIGLTITTTIRLATCMKSFAATETAREAGLPVIIPHAKLKTTRLQCLTANGMTAAHASCIAFPAR
jgi:TatD DNase family protein